MAPLNAASIDACLTMRSQVGSRRRRLETPVETPAVGGTSEPTQPEGAFIAPSEEEFIRLAQENPEKLVHIMQSTLAKRPALLTFAAEAAGRITNAALAVAVLVPLLGHADPVVREGANYGLEPHLGSSLEARDALRQMAQSELSPGVTAAIRDAFALLD